MWVKSCLPTRAACTWQTWKEIHSVSVQNRQSTAISMERTETDAHDHADMERLIAGHDAALNDLMERHGTPVFHFLCRMVGNEEDANDLAQETFVRVFKSRHSFRRGEKFSTWVYT